jgi:mRNA interferase MazF
VIGGKKFDEWNDVKKNLNNAKKDIFFEEREIFWASIGYNIGFEQNGKGKVFSRPVLVVTKFSKNIFLGVPLSSQIKDGNFFFKFKLNGEISTALLVQARLFDSKRLENKIGTMNKQNFLDLKNNLKKLMKL